MKPVRLVVLAALGLLVAANAFALGKGGTAVALNLGQTQGWFVNPENGIGYLGVNADERGQVLVGLELWHAFSDDYALAISGGYGFFASKDEPGDNALLGSEPIEYKTSAFQVRVGGDRYVKVGERASVFFGPGLLFWTGKGTYTNVYTAGDTDTPTSTVIGLNGRMGGQMKLGDAMGLSGHIGHTVGRGSAEEAGAKSSSWFTGFEAAGGLTFLFGGQ